MSGNCSEATLSLPVGIGDLLPELSRKRNMGGAPDAAPFQACIAHARLHALNDKPSLKFRHGADNLEHQATCRCGEVQIIS